MRDENREEKNEKLLNNPFALLDKKQFRPGPDKKGRIRPAAVKTPEPASSALPASDDELFLDAMRSVAPLGETRKTKNPQPRQNIDETEGINTVEMPSLREIRKAARRDREAVPTSALLVYEGGNAADEHPEESRSALTRRESVRLKSRNAVSKTRSEAEKPEPEADEAALFSSAMIHVAPLRGKGREVPSELPPPSPPVVAESNPLRDFMEGKLEFTLASTDEYVEGHVLGLDLLLVGKLQAGQFSPEAHVDLHGLNAQQAFQTLVGFIRAAYLKGQRTVLVVPGRGRNSPSGMGVLREKVQSWFTQEPFRRVVLAFCTARPTDGGAGALYVLLRKFRKDRGKVYWDRRPADPDLM